MARLAAAGIPVPENVRFLPIDLGSEPLDALLRDVGLSFSRPVFVSWLGVTFYLTWPSGPLRRPRPTDRAVSRNSCTTNSCRPLPSPRPVVGISTPETSSGS
ncbi:class I SAM-dependent methyltransferase [Frankia sp. CH37]|nr:class I SAM-dependent methyltransferase [Parafrankia sp. CH37]